MTKEKPDGLHPAGSYRVVAEAPTLAAPGAEAEQVPDMDISHGLPATHLESCCPSAMGCTDCHWDCTGRTLKHSRAIPWVSLVSTIGRPRLEVPLETKQGGYFKAPDGSTEKLEGQALAEG